MNPIFLSASVPDPKRDEKYFNTTDVIAIRDAVTALVEVALPQTRIYFGGHPAITPMVRRVAERLDLIQNVVLFQSRQFEAHFPPDVAHFPSLVLCDTLDEMRKQMIGRERFSAAFFIGGMEGIEKEYEDVRKSPMQRDVPLLPVASTGGGALLLWDRPLALSLPPELHAALRNDLNYVPLFRNILRRLG